MIDTFTTILLIAIYMFFGNAVLYAIKDINKSPKNCFYNIIGIALFPLILLVCGIMAMFDTDFK